MNDTQAKPVQPMLPTTGFVRQSQLLGREGQPGPVPVSPSTLWRLVRQGRFPAPVKLATRVTAWRVEDVAAWLAESRG